MKEPFHNNRRERVSLVRCASEATEEEVIRSTEEAIARLGDWGRSLGKARRIAVKINAGVDRCTLTDGRQTELTDPAVVEGAVRAIRRVTDAELLIGDATTDGNSRGLYEKLGYPKRLARYPRIRMIDFNHSPVVDIEMPFRDGMFRRYWMPKEIVEADAVVSLAKMKAHRSMGCTLAIKNLFGWMPTSVYGTPRMYLHDRLIRLPRVLSDIARYLKPSLNVIDGIVAANHGEWGGTPMRPGVIVAGTNIVATDSIAARAMGIDPACDYGDHPFHYRRNAIVLAASAGLGPIRPNEIEVLGPRPEHVATRFTVERYQNDGDRVEQLRRGAECVAKYREQQRDLAARHHNRYLALRDGRVLYDAPDMKTIQGRERDKGSDWRTAPQFVVRCLPPDEEIENFEWYGVEAAVAEGRERVRV